MAIQDFLSFIPKIGDGASWVVQKVVVQLSTWGINMTALQSKIILFIILGSLIYLLFSVLTIAKKMLKWGLIITAIFLAVSVAVSMFA